MRVFVRSLVAGLIAVCALCGCGHPSQPVRSAAAEPVLTSKPAAARTPQERVPPDQAGDVLFVYHPPEASAPLKDLPVFGAALTRLVTALNRAPAVAHPSDECTPIGSEAARLVFSLPGTSPPPKELIFRATLGSCGAVQVTFDGIAQPDLVLTAALRAAIRNATVVPRFVPAAGLPPHSLRTPVHSRTAAIVQADQALQVLQPPQSRQLSGARSIAVQDLEIFPPATVVERETVWAPV